MSMQAHGGARVEMTRGGCWFLVAAETNSPIRGNK